MQALDRSSRFVGIGALSTHLISNRRTPILLVLSYACSSMLGLSLAVVLPEIMMEFSINESEAGWLYSASLWSMAVVLTPSGYLADRFGQKKTLLLGYLLVAIGAIMLGLSQGYSECLVALSMTGVGAGLLVPSYYGMVGEELKQYRGFAIGFATAAYYLGGSIGAVLAGVFVSLHYWRLAYYAIGAIVFAMTVVQFLCVRSPTTQTRSSTRSRAFSSFIELMKTRNALISSVSILAASIGLYASAAWLPLFLLSFEGLGATTASMMLGLLMLTGMVSSPTAGALSDRVGRRLVVSASGFASAIISVPMLTSHYSLWSSVGYSLMLGFLLLPAWNLLITIAQESVSRESITSVTGITQTFGVIGSAAGPVIAGSLIPVFGISQALVYCIVFPAISYGVLTLAVVETRTKDRTSL